MTPKYKQKTKRLIKKYCIDDYLSGDKNIAARYIKAAKEIFPKGVYDVIRNRSKLVVFDIDHSGQCINLGGCLYGCNYVIVLRGGRYNEFGEIKFDVNYVADILFTLAHEFAHAWLGHNGGRKLKEEKAADKLAESWGFQQSDMSASLF